MVTVTVKLTEKEIDEIIIALSSMSFSDKSEQIKKDFKKIKDMIEKAKQERIKGIHGEQCED